MTLRIIALLALPLSLVGLSDVRAQQVAPKFGPSKRIQPGILFREATLQRGKVPMRVWFYQPEKAAGKLPLVLVPPAGSTLFIGMNLSDGDRTEHYPYVKAGFAVAAFEIDGHVPNLEKAADETVLKGAKAFKEADAGVANAKAALDFVLANVPNVAADRVYVAGHSSAATLALLVAANDPRVKACAAYAPCTDVEARLAKASPQLDQAIPGFAKFLRSSSPKTNVDKLKCPVFLFHAQDDDNVPIRETNEFAKLLKKTNPRVTFVTARTGGHHSSMIREGIPKGIDWFRKQKK